MVYAPQAKRVHGYYTLPMLHHGQLVGRVDAKTHRGEGRLKVRHVHFERWAAAVGTPPVGEGPRLDLDQLVGGLADALVSLDASCALRKWSCAGQPPADSAGLWRERCARRPGLRPDPR